MLKYDEEVLPTKWYNVVPDLPEPLPPPLSRSQEGSSIELLNRIIPREILRQEFSFNRYENIPEEVRGLYRLVGRPTPLIRANRLEKFLDYPGKIFLKYEGATVTGSHKINTAIPQAYYASGESVTGVVTETGAGQWGTATTLAAALTGLHSKVFMVRVSYDQKPLRKTVMALYGGEVVASPSRETEFGRKMLEKDPQSTGSLGIAISEAVEYALDHDMKYMVGSVMNSVLSHQSIIGQETMKQLEIAGEDPEVMIGCVGGGSNFGGFVFPFISNGKIEMIASTASEVPKFSRGKYDYDAMDTAGILPYVKMYSLGSDFIPPPIYSGGLRYHGAAPSLSILVKSGRISSQEVEEKEVLAALEIFARSTGIVAAPESGHAIASAIRYAKDHRHDPKTVVLNVSGHGNFDLSIYGGRAR